MRLCTTGQLVTQKLKLKRKENDNFVAITMTSTKLFCLIFTQNTKMYLYLFLNLFVFVPIHDKVLIRRGCIQGKIRYELKFSLKLTYQVFLKTKSLNLRTEYVNVNDL